MFAMLYNRWNYNYASLNNIINPEDILQNPVLLGKYIPKQIYESLKLQGYNPTPLNDGRLKDIPFESGGGFKINFGCDRIL